MLFLKTQKGHRFLKAYDITCMHLYADVCRCMQMRSHGERLMSNRSQRKGADGERELASELRKYGYEIRRGGSLSFGTVPDLVGLPGVHIECKRVEKLNVPAAMQQSIADSERFNDGVPALFHRRNRQQWLVTMRLTDWMRLYNGNVE